MGIAWFALALAAGVAPPRHAWPAPEVQRAMPREVGGLWLGKRQLRFQKDSLADIRARIGRGAIGHEGDAGSSRYWLCFSAEGPAGPQRIWLIADGEMGGSAHALTGVHAELLEQAAPASAACPALPRALLPLRLDNGLALGQPAARLEGLPPASGTPWRAWLYRARLPPSGAGGPADVSNLLEADVRDGRIRGLAVSHIVSH